MPAPRDPSHLLSRKPPNIADGVSPILPRDLLGGETAERWLWWNVLRQAAWDLRFSYDSMALDGLEFLRTTGQWLAVDVFGMNDRDYQREVAGLLYRRNRSRGKELPIHELAR